MQALTIDDVTDRRLHLAYAYWQWQCDGRRMPARRDIDPVDLRFCLGYVRLVEVLREPDHRFRFRVDGTRLAQIAGFDLTGKYADEYPDEVYREFMLTIYRRVVWSRSPIFLCRIEEWNTLGIGMESVALPLSSNGEQVDQILDIAVPVASKPPHLVSTVVGHGTGWAVPDATYSR